MARNRFSVVAPLVSLTILLAGTAARTSAQSPLAELMATAPNRFNPLAGDANPLPTLEKLLGVDQQFWVKVGPPDASLSVSLVEPPDKSRPPRGTILVLHGILARSATMLPAANALAKAGYRAVLVDLRGHGRSTGKFLTYGIQDAKDLSQVIDELARRNLLAGPLGAYGISYGATTAIHFAGGDRRVRALVAVEPFAAARDEVPHFGRVMAPGIGLLISERGYQEALDEAGRLAQFDPDAADAVKAIRQTTAQVLIVHGTNDWIVPHRHSELLHAAAPDHSQLVSIPYLGHVALWLDPGGRVAAEARAWFDRYLPPPGPPGPISTGGKPRMKAN